MKKAQQQAGASALVQREETCEPKEVGLKSFFLGPQAENAPWVQVVVQDIFNRWFYWRRSLFPKDGRAVSPLDQGSPEFLERRRSMESKITELVTRYEKEVPKFSPRYIGHMFSEISLPALFGHIITLLHNPNNISGETSRVGVKLEDEAIEALLAMMGFDPKIGSGHFTSGGTVANFEGLLRARERVVLWTALGALMRERGGASLSLFEAAHMGWDRFDKELKALKRNGISADDLRAWMWTEGNPWETAARLEKAYGEKFQGPVILVPDNKHYSWKKGASLLGFGGEAFWPVELDERGKLCARNLRARIEEARTSGRPVALVCSVAGTTELGEVDPIDEVVAQLGEWRKQGFHLWHHVDAAYGGFFCAIERANREILSEEVANALTAIAHADSVTLDPHKLGYVPYASGAFLTARREDYFVKSFNAPYLDYTAHVDRGPYTIEGSRSAAGAAATWMTEGSVGFNAGGYGRILARTIRIRQELEEAMVNAGLDVRIAPGGETNIVCFTVAKEGETVADANTRVRKIYDAFSPKGDGPFFVSKTALSWASYGNYLRKFVGSWKGGPSMEDVALVRICTMNPFFNSKEMSADFIEEFIAGLRSALR